MPNPIADHLRRKEEEKSATVRIDPEAVKIILKEYDRITPYLDVSRRYLDAAAPSVFQFRVIAATPARHGTKAASHVGAATLQVYLRSKAFFVKPIYVENLYQILVELERDDAGEFQTEQMKTTTDQNIARLQNSQEEIAQNFLYYQERHPY